MDLITWTNVGLLHRVGTMKGHLNCLFQAAVSGISFMFLNAMIVRETTKAHSSPERTTASVLDNKKERSSKNEQLR